MRFFMLLSLLTPILSFGNIDQMVFDLRREQRCIDAHSVKSSVALFDEEKPVPKMTGNGDEALYTDKRGNFGKALLHHANGYINTSAYHSLIFALRTEKESDFNNITLGLGRKLVNPQGSLVYSLAGNDSWINAIPEAPTFSSQETAGEMVELYWTTLVRDIPFNAFDTDATVGQAVLGLNQLTDFKGPKEGGSVTRNSFLRGNAPGELTGPYISQFLYQPIPFGATSIPPLMNVPTQSTANDFMTTFTDWYTVINGGSTGKTAAIDPTEHFIRTSRDLAEYVHNDFPGQGAMCAALLLLSYGPDALDENSPYLNNPTQVGFVTFGPGDILCLLNEAVEEGLKAAWFHKWQVNRRLRPEEFGFYLQRQIVNGEPLGINEELTTSSVLPLIFSTYGSYYLPQCYPEGSPTHPSYPAGHAVLIGAAVTILKAVFNEDFVIPNPVEPNSANTALIASGSSLTVGGELNKLASNVSLGRDHAGVHYRTDGWQGMLLGEQVAIDVLNNQSFLFNESFAGYTLTKFDGTQVTVGAKR